MSGAISPITSTAPWIKNCATRSSAILSTARYARRSSTAPGIFSTSPRMIGPSLCQSASAIVFMPGSRKNLPRRAREIQVRTFPGVRCAPGSRIGRLTALFRSSGEAMDHMVSNIFGGEQSQGGNREHNLQRFRSKFFFGYRLSAPLRRGPVAQTADTPNDVEIDQGAGQGQQHHGNADPVRVESGSGPDGKADNGIRQSGQTYRH